jgi:hypothetical protein
VAVSQGRRRGGPGLPHLPLEAVAVGQGSREALGLGGQHDLLTGCANLRLGAPNGCNRSVASDPYCPTAIPAIRAASIPHRG